MKECKENDDYPPMNIGRQKIQDRNQLIFEFNSSYISTSKRVVKTFISSNYYYMMVIAELWHWY